MKHVVKGIGSFANTLFGGALWFGFAPSWDLVVLMGILSFAGFLVWAALDFILFNREEARKP